MKHCLRAASASLAEEALGLPVPIPADERPELAQVVEAVRRRHEPAAGPRDAGELGERLLEIRNVIQHPVGHGHVERPVIERAGLSRRRHARRPHASAPARPSVARGRRRRHPRRAPPALRSANSPQPHPTSSTRRGSGSADRLERRLARIRAGDALVDRCARHQTVFRRVLLPDTLRVVQPSQGSRIGVPVSRFGGAFPPSQRFTVAPTSPNSPSWM